MPKRTKTMRKPMNDWSGNDRTPGGRPGGNRRGNMSRDAGFKGARNNRLRIRGNRFELPASEKIDYKNIVLLNRFLTDRGKMLSRRFTGVSAKQQRAISMSIKQARFLGLLTVGRMK